MQNPYATPFPATRNRIAVPKRTQVGVTTHIERVKKLIWAYFFLLVFEGALRKWIVPSLAGPLLLIRDPIVLAIYFMAWRANVLPRNLFIGSLMVLAFLSFAVGVLVPTGSIGTALYGMRANFLHLPLIFIMGRVLTPEDIKKIAKWTLILAIPLALLMVIQFRASPSSFINEGASGDFKQLGGVEDRIRPPATFSFTTGASLYFALCAAFLLNLQFVRASDRIPKWLIVVASISCLLAMSVSLSRNLIVNVGLISFIAFVSTIIFQPRFVARWLWCIGVAALFNFGASSVSDVNAGVGLLTNRIEGASKNGATGGDMLVRVIDVFTQPVADFYQAPMWGYGLGLGTNGGIALYQGAELPFISTEGEWSRHLLESGPILGGAFILWRLMLTVWLGWLALRSVAQGNILPILLFGIAGQSLLIGMFSQPTSLGFTAFVGGMCLAACKRQRTPASRVTLAPSSAFVPRTTM